jgi:hypothetical protein
MFRQGFFQTSSVKFKKFFAELFYKKAPAFYLKTINAHKENQ